MMKKNIFIGKVNNIALVSHDDMRLQNFYRIASHPYGAKLGKVCRTELLQYLQIISYFDDITGEKMRKHNPNWSYIPDHPYIKLIIEGAGP